MKRLLTIFLLSLTGTAHAHGRWILPSHSILSGERPEVVTFDFSITNDIFHPDNGYGGIPSEQLELLFTSDDNTSFSELTINQRNRWTRLKVTRPDGSIHTTTPIVDFGRKSVAGYTMKQNGTYAIEVAHQPIHYVTYQNAQNKRSRMFGKLTQIKNKLPKGADKIVSSKLTNRVKTYVTRNNVTRSNLKPATSGLDILFETHPNELFIGETASVQIYLHGKPVSEGTVIKITAAGTRYRNQRNTREFKTDHLGKATIPLSYVGLSLIEVELEQLANHADFTRDKYALSVSIEISQQ